MQKMKNQGLEQMEQIENKQQHGRISCNSIGNYVKYKQKALQLRE